MSKKKRKNINKVLILLFTFLILGTAILFVLVRKSQEGKEVVQTINLDLNEDSQNTISGLPSDFPVYQGSHFVTVAESDDGIGKSYIWEAEGDVGLIFEYLKSEMRIDGWKLSNNSSLGSSSAVSFEKGRYSGFLGVFKESGRKSVISVTIRMD